MLVGVCDFPGAYAFPPSGYGGIERWLWATAIGARRAGADPGYLNAHHADFAAGHVTLAGEVSGKTKARLLAEAGVLVYTCARDYVEAGAATFGEALRAGTPVAALAWRPGTSARPPARRPHARLDVGRPASHLNPAAAVQLSDGRELTTRCPGGQPPPGLEHADQGVG
jgi:hypothetical protein